VDLLDKEYNPKPVYSRLMKLIKEDWMTKNIQVKTDKNGQAAFRGFFGNYNIVVTKPDGSKQTIEVHLAEKGTNFWKFEFWLLKSNQYMNRKKLEYYGKEYSEHLP
jgi:endo-1,4-beta-xylanase